MNDLMPRSEVRPNIARPARIDNGQERKLLRVMFVALQGDALSLVVKELLLETSKDRRMEISVFSGDTHDVGIVVDVLDLHRESISKDSAQAIEVVGMEVCGEVAYSRECVFENSLQTITTDGKPKVLGELYNSRGATQLAHRQITSD